MHGQVAVLIDLENIIVSSLPKLFEKARSFGRISVKRVYAGLPTVNANRNLLLELGIEPIALLRLRKDGKNGSDIRLAIDAVELLYTSSIETFVIVSGDSDFVPLVTKLHAAGKKVIGAGPQSKAAPTLIDSCDDYIDLEPEQANLSIQKTALKAAKDLQSQTDSWDHQLNAAWSNRASKSGEKILGPRAALDATQILNVKKLKESPHTSLQKLLDHSPLLSQNWLRSGNEIVRK